MSVLNENTIIGASGAGGEYEIKQSLRFDDGRGTYLERTPTVAGNRKTWTWSGWVKLGNIGVTSILFDAYQGDGSTVRGAINVNTENEFEVVCVDNSSVVYRLKTSALLRDSSAWYHLLVAFDTTQSTSSNRVKMYINGTRVTSFGTEVYPNQNTEYQFNNTDPHRIGRNHGTTYSDAYLAEVNFIDGQALTPDSFGETGTYGEWKPLKYTGAYGTNGFYLPFEQDYTVEGFSTVTYGGTGASQYIGGTGFQPDFTWIKSRSDIQNNVLFDSVRGSTAYLRSNTTGAESTNGETIKSFDSDGFKLGTAFTNEVDYTYVAWNWDMGGTTASNTSGSITSSVRANTAYGQSIVSWTGDGGTGTVGHGLTSAPEFWITKDRASADNWLTFFTIVDGSLDAANLNLTNAAGTGSVSLPTSSVFTNDGYTSSQNLITYAFHSVTGYSKFSSYSGNGSTTGPVVTLGFSPAFVMIKRTDAVEQWRIFDNTRNPTNPVTRTLNANESNAESDNANNTLNFTSTGFQLTATNGGTNASGGTYIYMAFADTREYAYWYDQSGNNNDWTSEGGLTESDVMVDSPTNNFATLNPLDIQSQITLSEGNLKVRTNATGGGYKVRGTQQLTGKVYFEGMVGAVAGNIGSWFGIADNGGNITSFNSNRRNGFYYNASDMRKMVDGAVTVIGSGAATAGDVIGLSFDLDNNVFTIKKNNVALLTNQAFTDDVDFSTIVDIYRADSTDTGFILNFGQDSSFAGTKTPQGNQDANGIGDFYYAPSSGFLALCTSNLPSVDVIPSEHFNTVLYTGNDSTNVITGVGFKSDLSWWKKRNSAADHALIDSVRGVTKHLVSNTTTAEVTASSGTELVSFDSDGFTLGATNQTNSINGPSASIVAWNWKAGGSAVSNTNGSITSSVSANPSAGFSIVTYTGNGTAGATVGHGLSSVPTLVIAKSRTVSGKHWATYVESLGNTVRIDLESTGAKITGTGAWNSTTPTSSLVTIGSQSDVNTSGAGQLMYCFHSVDGYSKVGSYTGNGSSDGPFVHCGFRPAYVMYKNANGTGNWGLLDNERNTYNPNDDWMAANLSNSESNESQRLIDFLSNGFKVRGTNGDVNTNGQTYIFLAFAESPFKHTNAR